MTSVAVKGGSSLFSRVAWGIVIGFLLLHGGTLMFYNHEKMVGEASAFAASSAERALTVAEAAQTRPELLALLSTPSFSLSIENEPKEPPRRVWPHSDEVGSVLIERLSAIGFENPDNVRFWYRVGSRGMHLVLQLPQDNRWLVVEADGAGATGHTVVATFWTTVLGGTILFAVLWATRRFTRILPRLALAAERVGRDSNLPALPETGPKEIRRLTRAFNAMQERVTELLAQRNTMLGALSHDVRTLVTRLNLRMDSLEDEALREKSRADVSAITTLLDEALAFARDEAEVEQPLAVDLPSLLQSLLDDESDLGARTSYAGVTEAVVVAAPTALRRAFGNLIGNAIRYGGAVAVTVALDESNGWLVVDVTDPGSGISAEDQARALEPFQRLEPSRNRGTGGAGLGLSISRTIIERQGGSLEFLNSADGFTVRVRLLL